MTPTDKTISRRNFVRGVGGIGLLSAFPTIIPSSAFGANEAIRIGHIGVKNRGMQNLLPLLKHTVAVCDVDKDVLASARARVEKGGRSCKAYSDYRRLLDDKDAPDLAWVPHFVKLPGQKTGKVDRRNVMQVDIAMDRARELTLLLDPEHALDDRITMEQFLS